MLGDPEFGHLLYKNDMNVKITDTIHKDFSDIMRKELEEVGFDTSGITDDDIPFKYFTVSMRLIEKKPRKIFKSAGFSCPQDLQGGLDLLEDKIISGDSLFANQSKSVARLSSEDYMLYTWSIHHFHLGETIESDGFIKRTGPVLFAFVTDDAFYMIDIKAHGSWSDKDLLQKLYDNWPELMVSWKIEGKPEVNFSSNDIKNLRKAHINTIVQMNDGESYIGPGLGLTGAGTACEATHKVIHINSHIQKFLNDLRKDPLPFLSVKYNKEQISEMKNV